MGRVGRPFNGYGCLTGQGNGQGGREHGQKADQLPGYRRIDDAAARESVAALWGIAPEDLPGPGRSAYELLDALGRDRGIRGLLVMGSNPVVSAPNATHIEERLGALDFLVVCDFFLSETARLADVVLPSAQWAEEEGTMTNLEGRVIRRRRVVDPPAGVRTDLQILCGLARALGSPARHSVVAGRGADELRRATAGAPADYSGITTRASIASRACSGRVDREPGRARRACSPIASTRRRDGRAFTASSTFGPAERPDAEYPFYLTTGRVLAQYQSGTQTRRVASCARALPEAEAEMHPRAAQRAGLADGGDVTIETRRGRAAFRRQDDAAHPRGHDLRAVPLAGRAIGEPPDQPRARSDQPDAGIQSVRGADRRRRGGRSR